MLPISIPNITNETTVADANVGSLKRRRLTTGAVAVSSRITNPISAMAHVNAAIWISNESNQSSPGPSSNRYCSAPTPTTMRTMPAMSRFLRASSARARLATRTSSGSWTFWAVIIMPMIPTGRLM